MDGVTYTDDGDILNGIFEARRLVFCVALRHASCCTQAAGLCEETVRLSCLSPGNAMTLQVAGETLQKRRQPVRLYIFQPYHLCYCFSTCYMTKEC